MTVQPDTGAQSGIFDQRFSQFYHLEYLRRDVPDSLLKASITQALQQVSDELRVVVAFGQDCWQALSPDNMPDQLVDFTQYSGSSGMTMAATQSDVLFWVQGADTSQVMDQVMAIGRAIDGVLDLALDVAGFTYHDSRDLIGFVDGTANAKTQARYEHAQIPAGLNGAGGSYVLSQKWVHQLNRFNALSVPDQEQVVGRTKVDDIELEGDAQPPTSHVSRTDLKQDGVAQKIWRRSSPFANAAEQGLYFLAFSCELSRLDVQLKSMVGATQDGLYDRLMDYSSATSGAYWFAPSRSDLAAAIATS